MAIDKGLLLHWWHYYGKCIYTLEELNEFENIIDEYGVDKVLDAAIASYVFGDGSPTIILMSIRKGIVKELFESLASLDMSKMTDAQKEKHLRLREEFIQAISPTAK